MDTPELRTTETKSADATKMPPRRFDLTRLLTQRDRLPWFWFFFTVAVLLLSAMDRYHIVSQFKQRERVVIIDPAAGLGSALSCLCEAEKTRANLMPISTSRISR
jgi:hypothetical protein